MNATQKQLLTHAIRRIHEPARFGYLFIIVAALLHSVQAWLAIGGERQSALVAAVPTISWGLLFSGGRKSLATLPMTIRQYEMARWRFVFVFPALALSVITIAVYVFGAWRNSEQSIQAFVLYLLYTAGLLGLMAALNDYDLVTGKQAPRLGSYNLSFGSLILSTIVICAVIGVPTHGDWKIPLLTASSLGLLVGILYPLFEGIASLRSTLFSFNRAIRGLSSLLDYFGGATAFITRRVIIATVIAGLVVAFMFFVLPTGIKPGPAMVPAMMSALSLVWLSHFYSLGNLRSLRLLPLSLTQLSASLLFFSWLPTILFYLWAFLLAAGPTPFYSMVVQCALIQCAQALMLPTVIWGYATKLGWRALPKVIGSSVVHVLVSGVTAPQLAERMDTFLLLALFASSTYCSILWIRRVLTSSRMVYQS
jgi:hypothetical protein